MRIISRPGDLPPSGDVLIFGAGEGGRIVWEALSRNPAVRVLGFIDNQKTGSMLGLPVHRPADILPPAPGVAVVIASMFAREIAVQLRALGVEEPWSAALFLINHMQKRQMRLDRISWAALLLEGLATLVLPLMALAARFRAKTVDVGIGPECLINNRYHKKALEQAGFTAETFVNGLTHVTREFDHIFMGNRHSPLHLLTQLRIFWLACSRYRILYIYFTGCPFNPSFWLWRLEPLLFQLSGTRVVVMPYGQDVQDFTRCANLPFKHATTVDYPYQNRRRAWVKGRIDLWTRYADHVISGCDWVDYMHHWDTLLPGHFVVDMAEVRERAGAPAQAGAAPDEPADRPFRIVHTPNHRTIKGTRHLLAAVELLRAEGHAIELTVVEGASNRAVLEQMAGADLIVDQLVIGWYAMVAIEAMTLGKPVVCFIRQDLRELYEAAGVIERGELPLVHATPETLADTLRSLIQDRHGLRRAAELGPRFVRRHHSTERLAEVFGTINRRMGIGGAAGQATPRSSR
ncbi:MAG TPA: hypothetical protein VED40_05250 [Azospirillaceae bacterium]|nr:hypothetical protein [Azospirillaceae bacterium]